MNPVLNDLLLRGEWPTVEAFIRMGYDEDYSTVQQLMDAGFFEDAAMVVGSVESGALIDSCGEVIFANQD